MKLRTVILSLLFLFALIFFIVKYWDEPKRMEHTFHPMGGIPCRLVLYTDSKSDFELQVAAVMKRVDDLENTFNLYRSESEISQLVLGEPHKWHLVTPDMFDLLKRSFAWYGRSAGAFDVTVEPLIRLWRKAGKEQKVPSESKIMSVLDHVGSDFVTLSPTKGVRFAKSGVEITLGGIAKGYILGQIEELLQENGVEKYVVSCGGDVVMQGKETFRVGIQEPGKAEGHLMMVLKAGPGAVVTCGHYERFVEIEGKHYSHIIDPRTGKPAENDLVSITVIANDPTDADALATAIAVLGLEESIDLLSKTDLYKAIFLRQVDGQFEIYYSKALEGQLEYHAGWEQIKRMSF